VPRYQAEAIYHPVYEAGSSKIISAAVVAESEQLPRIASAFSAVIRGLATTTKANGEIEVGQSLLPLSAFSLAIAVHFRAATIAMQLRVVDPSDARRAAKKSNNIGQPQAQVPIKLLSPRLIDAVDLLPNFPPVISWVRSKFELLPVLGPDPPLLRNIDLNGLDGRVLLDQIAPEARSV
jgi:hypothetical protein